MKKQGKTFKYFSELLPEILLIITLTVFMASLFAEAAPISPQSENEVQAPQTVQTVQTAQTDPVDQEAAKLRETLQLSDGQATEVKKILSDSQRLTEKNRSRFKTNAPALVKAALQLRRDTHSRIEKLLDETQAEKFRASTKMTPFDRELFELTEGLLLDEDQAFTVEGILIEHENKLKDMIPPELLEMANSDEKTGGKDRIYAGTRGGRRGGGAMMPGRGRINKALKSLQKKKFKAIKKVLDNEQKLLLKQLREDRKKKMEERMKRQ